MARAGSLLSRAPRQPRSAGSLLERSTAFEHGLRVALCANLTSFEHREIETVRLRPAAVCIAVLQRPGSDSAAFLLTRRPRRLSRHSGQYALPGGRLDKGESAERAALRELEEELGIGQSSVNVVGRLDDYATRSGFRITPVVAWIDERVQIRADASEVEAFFYVPLDDLLRPGIPRLRAIDESDRPVLSIEFASLGDEVFAPTAAILYQFREVALCGRATRVAHYDQPVFAWR